MKRSALELLIQDGVPEETAEAFVQYHLDNPEVWQWFEKFTLEAIARGRRMGAKAVAERVRWEIEIEHNRKFKVGNSWIAYYARIFMLKYRHQRPHNGYFRTKKVKGVKTKEAA